MKVKRFKSFRFKMIMYMFLSLLATIATEGLIFMGIYLYETEIIAGEYKKVWGASGQGKMSLGTFTMSQSVALDAWVIVIFTILLLVIYFILISNKFVMYVREIISGVERMKSGDLMEEIPVQGEDEFSEIAASINEMRQNLYETMESQKAVEKTKDELITNVAHDLRTPLTSIIGYIDIVNNMPDLSEKQRSEYLKITWEKARKLEKLINELFSFTKISYGGMPMRMEKIDVIKLLEQEADELYPTFKENELECLLETDADSCMIMADGEQLVRVFDNLLGNAIKYGRYGKMIRIRTLTENTQIQIQIVNYGSVIPAENLPFLFEKFYKVDASRQPSSEGTGLGLAIAKSIVESHGGSISVRSSFEGTVFEVVLPTAGAYQNGVVA